MDFITVEQILKEKGKEWDLKLLAGVAGLRNKITTSELNRPGLAFAGFMEVFSHSRIQILGITEISYLNSLDKNDRHQRLKRIFKFYLPCFIITSGQSIGSDFLDIANSHNVPVLATSLLTSKFSSHLLQYLEGKFAPSCCVHGTLLDVYGMGVLLMGKSGVGKSEAALELVERGHRLVADDVITLKRLAKDLVIGSRSEIIQHHMEIRGLGIIDVESLFGAGSVREEKKVSLVVQLEKWDETREYERLGLDEKTCAILDVNLPEYTIPVVPGRNLSILVEVAALNQRLKTVGRSPAEKFNRMLLEKMRQQAVEQIPSSEPPK